MREIRPCPLPWSWHPSSRQSVWKSARASDHLAGVWCSGRSCAVQQCLEKPSVYMHADFSPTASFRASDLVMKVDALLSAQPKGDTRIEYQVLEDSHRYGSLVCAVGAALCRGIDMLSLSASRFPAWRSVHCVRVAPTTETPLSRWCPPITHVAGEWNPWWGSAHWCSPSHHCVEGRRSLPGHCLGNVS